MNTFYNQEELLAMGFAHLGENVLISRKTSIYEPAKLVIGDNIRIDDFCLLSGSIELGRCIHLSAYCALYGKYGIRIADYSGLSPRCTIFSGNDDFSGEWMISPMAPTEYTNVFGAFVAIEKFVQIGTGTIVMPGVKIGEGCAIGAMSFIKSSIPEWSIYAGNPARFIKERSKKLLEKYEKFIGE